MAVSQNGWSANDRSVIQTYIVGDNRRIALRKGDAGFLLVHVANWFDKNIKDIDPGILDDWGYAERPIRGGTTLSNHASGTAIDVDATKWPLGVDASRYLNADEIRRLRDHLKIYEGAIRWGGDYSGRKDPMHFEINANASTVERVANKLRNLKENSISPANPFDEVLTFGDINAEAVKVLQETLNRWYPNEPKLATDGDFGPGTLARVKYFQTKSGLKPDGEVGPVSRTKLGLKVPSAYDPPYTVIGHTLDSGKQLNRNQALVSEKGNYRLVMQLDGNVVVYSKENKAVWASNTWGFCTKLAMQHDGNLVAYNSGDKPFWNSATWNTGGGRTVMQDDGNLVVYNWGWGPVWDSQGFTRK